MDTLILSVLNIEMDKKGGLARTHLKSQETVKNRAAQLDLVDAWRATNILGVGESLKFYAA